MSDDAPEALYQHCVKVYEEMLSTAKIMSSDRYIEPERLENMPSEGNDVVVWEGMLTTLITSKLNLSVPYYTSVTRALKRMGCIRQIKRGGGTAPSQWELIREPTEQLFNETKPLKAKAQDKYALMQDQITNLNSRVAVLERAMKRIIMEETNG